MTYPTPEEARALMRVDESCIVGVDPGDKTGVVTLWNNGRVTYDTLAYLEFLRRLVTFYYRGVFAVESFVTRPGAFAKTQIAGKVCGACDLYCLQNALPIVYHSPAAMKTMLPDTKALRSAGWQWHTPHELDALRHVLYYLLTRK